MSTRDKSAVNVLTEILSITEKGNSEAIVVFNDGVLAPGANRIEVMKAISVLGRKKLLTDAVNSPEGKLIERSVDPQHSNVYMELRFMVDSANNLTTLVYFGGLTDLDTLVSYALIHAAEVLDIVVKSYAL